MRVIIDLDRSDKTVIALTGHDLMLLEKGKEVLTKCGSFVLTVDHSSDESDHPVGYVVEGT